MNSGRFSLWESRSLYDVSKSEGARYSDVNEVTHMGRQRV